MKVETLTVGMFQANCFLVTDPATGATVLVDTGESPVIVEQVQRRAPELAGILLTHAHVDHAGALAALQEVFTCPASMAARERPLFESLPQQGNWFGMPQLNRDCGRIDRELHDGDEIQVGESTLRVMLTPGHSPGHACFYDDEILLAGDLLFAGSIGRTDLPLGDPRAMQQSLERVMELPPSLRVYCGHGPQTTLERELRSNPFLLQIRRRAGGR